MAAPRTDWKEQILPDEAERFERLAVELRDTPKRAPGEKLRALHAKGVAGVRAELIVRDDVPALARVGIFAQPGTYRAYVRFSNGAAVPQPDSKPDVRGLAVKVLGVPGTKSSRVWKPRRRRTSSASATNTHHSRAPTSSSGWRVRPRIS